MVSEGAPLTLDLEPLALGAHCLLVWIPALSMGLHWLDLGPQPASGNPLPMVSTVVPLALCLGAPSALEPPNDIALERLPALCSIGSCSGAPGSFKGLLVPKGAHWLLGALRA